MELKEKLKSIITKSIETKQAILEDEHFKGI